VPDDDAESEDHEGDDDGQQPLPPRVDVHGILLFWVTPRLTRPFLGQDAPCASSGAGQVMGDDRYIFI
jgi:hypothetical protein